MASLLLLILCVAISQASATDRVIKGLTVETTASAATVIDYRKLFLFCAAVYLNMLQIV